MNIRKIIALLIGALLTFNVQADVWQAEYGVARTFDFVLYNADGTLDVDEADGGTEVTVDCNGTPATATDDFDDEGAFYDIDLTATEMQCERITVTITATLTSVFHIETFGHTSAFNETLGWLTGDAFARVGAAGAGLTNIDLPNQTMDITGNITTVTTVNGFANDALVAADIAADVTTELQTGLATAAALSTVDDFVDTEVATLIEALIGLGAEQTADSGTTTTAVDAALTQATNDWFKGMGIHFTSSTLLGQDACVTGFTAASDTLTFAPAVTTAVTTHNYYLLPNSECFSGASGSGATAQEVWEYPTRAITVLDEDTTTIDLNNTTVGTLTMLDEDSTTLDLNATPTGAAASVTGAVGSVATAGITEASFDTTAGSFGPLGITDQGTSPSAATATTLVLRAATPFSSDDANKGQTLWAFGSTQGYWQSETITAYATATDTATVNTWDVTPSGTITYKIFGTAEAAAGAGGGATAQEVWEYGTRVLTSLDEDVTTLDLNATTVGTILTLDEDTTTLDLNATTIGTVTTATATTTVNGLAAGVVTAAAVATGAFDADALAADAGTEIWAVGTKTLTAIDEDNTTIDLDASTVGTVTNVGEASIRTALGMAAANLDTQLTNADTDLNALLVARAQLYPGGTDADSILTADSGDTNTLVDTELTFANNVDIDGAYVVRSDGQRCFIDSFTAATDTIEFGACTFTGVWATQTYEIYPAGTQ